VERKLVAILAADVVGYSRLMGEDEAGTLDALRSQQKTLIEPTVIRHKGRIVKLMGDGVLIEFGSVVKAVGCAVDLQQRLAAANAGTPEARQMKLRVGINLSDVIVENGDLYGEGVNVAARLEQLAEPGGICVSASAYDQVRHKLDLQYVDLGEQRLKNIAQPVQVYRIELPQALAGRAPGSAGRRKSAAAPVNKSHKPSIVVLPFANLNGDKEQDFVCDGLTQDVTTDLSRFSNLFVIAAHSAFTYKGRPITAQEIGRELGVRYMLEGAVQRSKRKIRINIQLVDTADDHHLWAHRFDAAAQDLIQAQDQIVQKLIAMLAVRIDAAERERVLRRGTTVSTAYECYLRGAHCYSHESAERLEICRGLFEEATRLDPEYARAWGYLAYTTMRAVIHGWLAPEAGETALARARKAVEFDPFDYANHWDLAFVLWNLHHFGQALTEYRRAISLNPNDADLLAEMAETLAYWGEPQEAVRQLRKAMQINPFHPDWYRWNLGWALFSARQYEDSLAELAQMSELPSNVHLIMAADHVRLRQHVEAAAAVTAFLQREPGYTLARLKMRTAFRRPEDEQHWLDAVREAGLPG
jgi:adenylate cyclase